MERCGKNSTALQPEEKNAHKITYIIRCCSFIQRLLIKRGFNTCTSTQFSSGTHFGVRVLIKTNTLSLKCIPKEKRKKSWDGTWFYDVRDNKLLPIFKIHQKIVQLLPRVLSTKFRDCSFRLSQEIVHRVNTRKRMSWYSTYILNCATNLVELTNPPTDFCQRCCKNCRLVVEFFLGHSKHDYLAQAHQNGLRKNKQHILNTTSQELLLRNRLVTLIVKRILAMGLAIQENRKKLNQSIIA